MALRIIKCSATSNTVVVYFSEPLDTTNRGKGADNNPDLGTNYTVVQQTGAKGKVTVKAANYDAVEKASFLQLEKTQEKGIWLSVVGCGVAPVDGVAGTDPFFVLVNGEDKLEENVRRAAQAAKDVVAYPITKEQVGVPPSSSCINGGGGTASGASSSGSGMQIGQGANQAIADVLGWKINDNDPKGFIGALTQSLTETEGHVDATWTSRTYAVQTDLSGGITGVQGSLYSRAQQALQQSLPLLDGLYALNPDSDPEMVTALKDIVKSQFTELVNELGYAGGPRVSRVNQYFHLLQGGKLFPVKSDPTFTVTSDPDLVEGAMGRLRKGLQLQSFSHYVNTVEDEQAATNYRVLSDYLTSLSQSWVNNVGFFGLDTKEA